MNNNYEYEATPRKYTTEYWDREEKRRKKEEYNKRLKRNEEQKKVALKMEKKKHKNNVAFVLVIFFILLVISYRSSLINERFSEIQTSKEKLASIEKTNGQLEVSIQSSINLSNIEESAKEKLGMKKLDNNQKVFLTLDKKDYVEASSTEIDMTEEDNESWLEKFFSKIFGNK